MKKLIKSIKEKLQINTMQKDEKGNYVMSKKQKKLWVLGLFLFAWVYSIIRLCISDKYDKYTLDVVIITSILCAIVLVILSFVAVWPFFMMARMKFFILMKKEIGEVSLYQLWTIFLIAIMLCLILRVKLSVISPLLGLHQ